VDAQRVVRAAWRARIFEHVEENVEEIAAVDDGLRWDVEVDCARDRERWTIAAGDARCMLHFAYSNAMYAPSERSVAWLYRNHHRGQQRLLRRGDARRRVKGSTHDAIRCASHTSRL
jgi:hypothetical protein